ncbi:MAG TPA: cysteine desulfurase family protein [Lacipirellulaceae bacterium]|nr:cysteine desulfurase family protein [Lacipirellulaceae bacterium]
MPAPLYFDHNATTPAFPEVVEAMRACWAKPYLNPASQHSFGRAARRVLEDARDRIGELLGAASQDRVIFTSGGTEANHLAFNIRIPRREQPPHTNPPLETELFSFVVSSIEHPSVSSQADEMESILDKFGQTGGRAIKRVTVGSDGVVMLTDLEQCLTPATRFAAIMLANNETGVIQPIAEAASICNRHKVPLVVDAAQAAGKRAINFCELGLGTMTIAAHKFGGPLGIGALLVRNGIEISPKFRGGFQQAGTRPGTESVALAVGMCTALELWHERRHEWSGRITQMRDEFETALCREGALTNCTPVIIGKASPRLPTTSNIAFVGLDRQQLFLALDQAGVACSTGSACASGSSEPSPTHIAMGLDAAVISSALRFSFGVSTTRDDVADGCRRIINVCNGLRR